MLFSFVFAWRIDSVLRGNVLVTNMRSQINTGRISAIGNGFSSVAAAISPTIVGALVDKFGTWCIPYLVALSCLFVMTLLLILSKILIAVKNKKEN